MDEQQECVYLGDGAYAMTGRYLGEVIVTADHHEVELASNVVYLDPGAVRTLKRFLQKLEARSPDD